MENNDDQGTSKKTEQNSSSDRPNSSSADEAGSEPLGLLKTETLETAVNQLDSIIQQRQPEKSHSAQSASDSDGRPGPSSRPSVHSDGAHNSDSQRPRTRQQRQRMKHRIMTRVVERTRNMQREMDNFMIQVLHDMLRNEGLDIPKDELADGFEEFWKMYSTGMVSPGPWLDYWNDDQHTGTSEE